MNNTVTLADIEKLLGFPSEQLVPLWTIQHRCAVKTLRAGQYVSRRDYVRGKDQDDKCRKLRAYQWMADQMQRRGLPLEADAVPIWAFFSDPRGPCWQDRPDDKLLRIQIPKGRMLISFHKAWDRFLKAGADPTREYLKANDEDEKALQAANYKQPRPIDCENSWQKIFCLSLARSPGFLLGLTLQAALPILYESDEVGGPQDQW
jgi:hypothetical protein